MSIKPDKKVSLHNRLAGPVPGSGSDKLPSTPGDGGQGASSGKPVLSRRRYRVAFSDVTVAGDLVIRPLPRVADNGSLVYQVLTPQGASLGLSTTFPGRIRTRSSGNCPEAT